MNKSKQILLITILLLCFNQTFSQWVKVNSIPSGVIVALGINNNNIYAASFTNKIYESSDNGLTWRTLTVSEDNISIFVLTFFDNKIYAGTISSGIFVSSDDGDTWLKGNSSPNAVSDFAIKDNILYASTLGNGVAVLDTMTNNWSFINDSLPSYSVNVQRIVASEKFLIIAAGANGTFYNYDFNSDSWMEGFYYGFLRPGLQINNLINIGDTIYAVNGNRIIRSDNAGESWEDDEVGTHDGVYRNIFSGLNNLYSITNVVIGGSGTWIQKRNKYAGTGTSWAEDEEFFAGLFSYDIIEYNNNLFLAREDGLYIFNTEFGLPVELSSFTASTFAGSVTLDWTTVTEKNNLGFEVERNIGGVFTTIGFVDGYGTSTEPQKYSYTDDELDNGVYNYRLKQIDFNGTFDYSEIVEVEVLVPSVFKLEQNYPNPFNPTTIIRYSITERSFIKITIYNTLGEEVRKLVAEEKPAGLYEINFNGSDLQSGIYFYSLESNKYTYTRKMILLK
jgi:photosystem II stability/assembly factor-like uncharacterized protein